MAQMATAFHDTLFSYILRFAFGSRVFPHLDEKVLPTIWQEKLTSQALTTNSIQPKPDDIPSPDATSVFTEATAIASIPGGMDPEKGQDLLLVDWYGPTDPDVSYWCGMFLSLLRTSKYQNPLNWSNAKKSWVMLQTCLLTIAVYLGPGTYTTGIPYITSKFHVSNVTATVGLTAFVSDYGLGSSRHSLSCLFRFNYVIRSHGLVLFE